jgi:hypothetical protein
MREATIDSARRVLAVIMVLLAVAAVVIVVVAAALAIALGVVFSSCVSFS